MHGCAYHTYKILKILRILLINNKILRILLKKKIDTPIRDLYTQFNTLPIHLLYKKQLLIFVHKYLNHKYDLPVIFRNCFTENTSIHDHDTRQKTDLHLYMNTEVDGGGVADMALTYLQQPEPQ